MSSDPRYEQAERRNAFNWDTWVKEDRPLALLALTEAKALRILATEWIGSPQYAEALKQYRRALDERRKLLDKRHAA